MNRTAHHIQARVLEGHRIEIYDPTLKVGDAVEVVVLSPNIEKIDAARERSILEIIESSPGGQMFKTAADVDAYLKEERDSWDR